MRYDWTYCEKRLAICIEKTGNFADFLEYHLEIFEELVNCEYDVFQIAKEVFQIESLVDEYENLEGFLQRLPDLGRDVELGIPLVDRHGLKINEYRPTYQPECKLKFFVVQGVNSVEILVHTSAVEFYKKYL